VTRIDGVRIYNRVVRADGVRRARGVNSVKRYKCSRPEAGDSETALFRT